MTTWQPDLGTQRRPLYRAIADALASDIRTGRLPVGTRLPTHRDLAWDLKVTVGTVTRAYAEAERRGLISGEVGRGTFVRPAGTAGAVIHAIEPPTADFVDLSVNRPQTSGEAALLAKGLREIASGDSLETLLQYQPHAGRPVDREAGARWIARSGVATDAEHVLVTQSGQNAVASVLSAVTQPGDTVACESLTYPGVRSAASLLNLRLAPVAMDGDGLIPESFAALCRSGSVKALYTLPTLHNPTATVLSSERRQAVVATARAHGVALIEDDVYGFLLEKAPPPFARLSPELGFYITSTSKSLAPGIRIGYVHAPTGALERVAAALRATVYMATPLMAALATRCIEDGTAERIVAAKRDETAERQKAAREILQNARLSGNPAAPHLLLWMPEGWRADTFESAARRQGVGVTPATAFWLGRNAPPNAVRLCLGTPAKRADLVRALQRIGALLAQESQSYLSVI
ncbi:MAG TPA: PLP-dependent aminotransferase family protein [Stellaceae bacterium]|nr:PLP-dependent aminotransferase family protein [Stellaceae bacterium]